MSGEPPFIRVLRESLEAEVTPSVASAALFAGLAAWGPRVPASFVEVVDLVHGPLRAQLAARVGAERAAQLTRELEQRLRLAEMPTGVVAAAPRERFEEPTTHSMPKLSGPVDVRVIAGSPTLETLMVSALGPDRVAFVDEAAMLILDASDPPTSWGAELERLAHAAPTVCVYGTDLPAGRDAAKRLDSAKVAFLGFDTEHGAAPILDLIRARTG